MSPFNDKVAAILAQIEPCYAICVVVGSGAVRLFLEDCLENLKKGSSTIDFTMEQIERFLAVIIPNDVDIIVTSNRKHFDAHCDMPKVFGDYVRESIIPSKSCTYCNPNNGESFDLVYVGGSIQYITINGINILVPASIAEEYIDNLETKNRANKKELDREKIEACNLLSTFYANHKIHTSKQSDRLKSNHMYDRNRSPIRSNVCKKLVFD